MNPGIPTKLTTPTRQWPILEMPPQGDGECTYGGTERVARRLSSASPRGANPAGQRRGASHARRQITTAMLIIFLQKPWLSDPGRTPRQSSVAKDGWRRPPKGCRDGLIAKDRFHPSILICIAPIHAHGGWEFEIYCSARAQPATDCLSTTDDVCVVGKVIVVLVQSHVANYSCLSLLKRGI